MNHAVELNIYTNENNDENQLEVTFDIDFSSYEITGYYIDGNKIDYEDLLENNPKLAKQIDRAIDHYVTNYEVEPVFDDCE